MMEAKKMRLLVITLIIVLLATSVQATIVDEVVGTMSMASSNGAISTSASNNDHGISIRFRSAVTTSGGGGGGGDSTENPNPTMTHGFVSGLKANTTYNSIVNNDDIFVLNITFQVNKNIPYEVELRISEILDINKEPVPPISGKKFGLKYAGIFYSGVSNSDFKEATISFAINKETLSLNGASPNDLKLLRYNSGNWVELKTIILEETDKRIIYKAFSPGFSYFAAAIPNKNYVDNSETNDNALTGNVINNQDNEDTQTNNVEQRTNDEEDNSTTNSNKKKNNVFPIIVVLILGGILGIYVYISKQRDQQGLYNDEQGIIIKDEKETFVKQNPFGTADISEEVFKSPENQLHDYIEEELREGYTRQDIEAELLKAGWDKLMVTEAIDNFKDSFMQKKQVHQPSENFDNLKNFISNKIAKGYSEEVIKKNLLRVGWQEPIVNSVIYEVNNPAKKTIANDAKSQLDDFIRKALHRGHSKEQVVEKLMNVGWQKKIIDEVMKKYK